jgi:hypothetical protein
MDPEVLEREWELDGDAIVPEVRFSSIRSM